MLPHRIAVVVPYYQRQPGILRRAIRSVLRQTGDFTCEVIIVDDGSPASAAEELEQIEVGNAGLRLKLIKQRNAGPGAARNAALNEVASETEFVAFLDSDDEWTPGHLQNAISALDRGFDFYFSDFLFSDFKQQSAFVRGGKIRPEEHRIVDAQACIYQFDHDMTDQILVKGNVIGTSNVVYRYSAHSQVRFREAFFNGQDYLFWLDLAQVTERFVFSTSVECECGTGVNIYAGAGWGTERSLFRLANELQLWRAVRRLYPLTETQKDGVYVKIDRVRESIVRDVLHRVSHAKSVQLSMLRRIAQLDPLLTYKAIIIASRMAIQKLRAA